MKINIRKNYKSIKYQPEFELPDFVVLTGKNGSGKSHLMEAMSNSEFCTVTNNGNVLGIIKYIPFNGLYPIVNTDCNYLDVVNLRKRAWEQLNYQIQNFKKVCVGDLKSYFHTYKILGFWYNKVNGDLEKLTEDFVLENYAVFSEEMFSGNFASVFKLYQIRYDENRYYRFLNDTENENNIVLSDKEFVERYGPKPWELVNWILENAQLPYRVNYPKGHRDAAFHLKLSDINSGIEVKFDDLSTGEKVLMSLALSIYNSNEEMLRPDVLLFDEPDASLHPEFSKVFIDSVIEYIVKKAGIKVIISTHSPTTVAISPEDSIYSMNKNISRPEKISKEQAINILTQDLDNIRLSFENRRQVFVESKYDVQYYTRIFKFISYPFKTSPQFLPPKSGNCSNCDEVSNIVNELRRLGNDLVYGIKDFDNKNHSSDYILILGEEKRYAIDNYIFDPIYVAFLLIRENILETENIGLSSTTFVTLSQLKDDEIQCLIDYIIKELGLSSENTIEYMVQCGKQFHATKEYFFIQGHELEDKIKNKWPKLKSIAKGGDNVLKNYILDTVFKNYPQFISVDFVELFKHII